MLKYTLGALAALVIVATTGFIILAQVSDGGADIGPAPRVIVTVIEDGSVPPLVLHAAQGKIISLELNNRSSIARSIRLDSDGAETLPQVPTSSEDVVSRDAVPGISFDASAGTVGSKLVRFKEKGEYQLNIGYAGVLFPPIAVTIVID